jgi:hypothetical protein
MSVELRGDGVVVLIGVCPIEDAEVLLRRLSDNPAVAVDWSGCEQLHTAVIQVLLAAKPQIVGQPTNKFLSEHMKSLAGGF